MDDEHNIDLDDMLAYVEMEAESWRTYASDVWRRLEFRLAGGYRVRVMSRFVYEGTDGRSAVNAYNAATRT